MLILAMVAALAASAAPVRPTVEPVPFGLFAPDDMTATIGASFSPDGRTVYFSKALPGGSLQTIFVSHETNGRWSAPEVASFSGTYPDADAALIDGGAAVLFSSARPPSPDNFELYEAFLTGPRAGEVVHLPNSVNAKGSEFFPSLAPDGTLYFTLSAGGGYRLYSVPSIVPETSAASAVALAGDADGVSDFDETLSGDGSFMIFARSHGHTNGGDLVASFRQAGHWCAPIPLPDSVNASLEMATGLSPDGRTLYFASSRTDFEAARDRPIDAAGYRAMLGHFANNSLHTYRSPIGTWLDAVRSAPCA